MDIGRGAGSCMSPQRKVERRLAAIFAADVAGYSRLMEADEAGTLRALTARREIMDALIDEHGGRIANTAGDSILAEFPSAVDAVQCAVDIQDRLDLEPEGRNLRFRIGVHVGDVVVREGDLLGDGVNVAARLQELAYPGSVCVSEAAYAYVRKLLPLTFSDLGLQRVKNMEEPVRAYAVKSGHHPPAGCGSCQDAAAAGQALDRRASLHQSERRPGAGIFRRRPGRGHHHGLEPGAVVLRHRPQLVLHLQGPRRRRPADLPRARRSLRIGGQHPQGGFARAHRRPAHRRHDRASCLGRAFRRRHERHLRIAGPGDGKRRRRGRAKHPARGDPARAQQADDLRHRLRSLSARPARLLQR